MASLLQISIYVAWSLLPAKLVALFYFDPRIGLFFIESGFRGAELRVPGILQWLSAIWLLLISVLLVSGRSILKTYIISEVIASIPNLFFFVVIVLANLSPAHGFSVGELTCPVLAMMVFSIIPVTLAFRMWRKSTQPVISTPSRAEQALGADSPVSSRYS